MSLFNSHYEINVIKFKDQCDNLCATLYKSFVLETFQK